jgi:hypothetical protein
MALAALLAASGCRTATVRHPKHTERIDLAADRAAPDVEMVVVDAVEVGLPPGPDGSAGFVWEIASNNAQILEQMGPLKAAPAAGSGAPPATVSFFALKPGRSILRFVLVRPGEAETTPAAKCQVMVRVSD